MNGKNTCLDRIAHHIAIDDFYGPGGVSTYLQNIAKENKYFEMDFFVQHKPGERRHEQLTKHSRIIRYSIPHYEYSIEKRFQRSLPKRTCAIPFTILEIYRLLHLRKLLVKNKYDIINIHHDWGLDDVIKRKIRISNLKKVFMNEKLLNKIGRYNKIGIPVLYTDHSRLCYNTPNVITSLYENILCVDHIGYKNMIKYNNEMNAGKNLWYVPNSVDTNKFNYKNKRGSDYLRIGYAGRLGKEPIQFFFDLANSLPKEVKLTLCFSGDATEIKRLSLEFKDRNVDIIENLPYEKMPFFYNNQDLIIDPIDVRANDRIIFEGMASGCPIIMKNNVDRYPVIHNETGYLYDGGLKDLINLIIFINDNRKQLSRIARNARLKIIDEFSNEVVIPKLMSVYKEVIMNKLGVL